MRFALWLCLQLIDFAGRRVADIETAGDEHLITMLYAGQDPLFHANLYAVRFCRVLLSA